MPMSAKIMMAEGWTKYFYLSLILLNTPWTFHAQGMSATKVRWAFLIPRTEIWCLQTPKKIGLKIWSFNSVKCGWHCGEHNLSAKTSHRYVPGTKFCAHNLPVRLYAGLSVCIYRKIPNIIPPNIIPPNIISQGLYSEFYGNYLKI